MGSKVVPHIAEYKWYGAPFVQFWGFSAYYINLAAETARVRNSDNERSSRFDEGGDSINFPVARPILYDDGVI